MGIRVDAAFPGGNAGDIAIDEAGTPPVVSFAGAPHGGPETLWFDLRVSIDPPVPVIRLVLKHFANSLGAPTENVHGLRPVIRTAAADWQRLPVGTVVPLPDGRAEIEWTIRDPGPSLELAFCYPYGQPELQALLAETGGYWSADTIGLSQGGRPLLRLSNGYGSPDAAEQKPGVYLIARQHAAETPGSWVLDGFLRAAAAKREDAVRIWCVPFSNADGVAQGDYGKDNFPYDLNRAWGAPPMRHETLVIQRDIQRWSKRCRPVAGLDFHAPGAVESDGVYAFVPSPPGRAGLVAETVRWGQRIAEAVGGFAATSFCRSADYRSRWETPNFTSFMMTAHRCVGLTVETPYALCRETAMTREDYRAVGARMAAAVAELAAGGPAA